MPSYASMLGDLVDTVYLGEYARWKHFLTLVGEPNGSEPSPRIVCQNATLNRSLQPGTKDGSENKAQLCQK